MGSIPLDNGESVYIHDGTGSADPVAISAAEGSSVANLMKNRERFTYTWADNAARINQTGMVQGSLGYQTNTRTEYIYDAGVWRIVPAYVEFTASDQTVAAGTTQQMTGFSLDAARSTDTSIVTWSVNRFSIEKPGIYVATMTVYSSGAGTGWVAWDEGGGWNPANGQLLSISPILANTGTVTTHFRTTSDDYLLYLWHYNTVAGTLSQQSVRITRLG